MCSSLCSRDHSWGTVITLGHWLTHTVHDTHLSQLILFHSLGPDLVLFMDGSLKHFSGATLIPLGYICRTTIFLWDLKFLWRVVTDVHSWISLWQVEQTVTCVCVSGTTDDALCMDWMTLNLCALPPLVMLNSVLIRLSKVLALDSTAAITAGRGARVVASDADYGLGFYCCYHCW